MDTGSSGSGGPSYQPIPPTRGGAPGGLRQSSSASAAALTAAVAERAQAQAQAAAQLAQDRSLLQQAQSVPVVTGSLPGDPWQQPGVDPWAAAQAAHAAQAAQAAAHVPGSLTGSQMHKLTSRLNRQHKTPGLVMFLQCNPPSHQQSPHKELPLQ